ncbi:MAG: polymer-forming cytoskeletal protein [candidate division Zixibacteria bacterium]|nr:polymer-forming cytoskeletal protein [candidate division Zixibacteria bacterium]
MIKKSTNNEVDGLMNTIIGKDTIITGTLDVKGALRVDGTVKGKVICSDCVTIGATGLVEAEIEADTAIVAGRMVGNINAVEKIELQAKCEMEGDLKTKSLVIEQGAVFCGACNMKDRGPDLGFLPAEKQKAEILVNRDDD